MSIDPIVQGTLIRPPQKGIGVNSFVGLPPIRACYSWADFFIPFRLDSL